MKEGIELKAANISMFIKLTVGWLSLDKNYTGRSKRRVNTKK